MNGVLAVLSVGAGDDRSMSLSRMHAVKDALHGHMSATDVLLSGLVPQCEFERAPPCSTGGTTLQFSDDAVPIVQDLERQSADVTARVDQQPHSTHSLVSCASLI